ncbi:MAG: helicase-related protein, partial [Candidatus Thorarchaeota archaeon]
IQPIYGKGFYSEIVETLKELTYSRYSLGNYILPEYQSKGAYFNLSTIGNNLRGLMKSLLLKRLESSIHAFKETLKRTLNSYTNFLGLINEGKIVLGKKVDQLLREEDDLESISETVDYLLKENKIEFYDPNAFNIEKLKKDLNRDIGDLSILFNKIEKICNDIHGDYQRDNKLLNLKDLIESIILGRKEIVENPFNKILIFSQYSDTIEYIKNAFNWFQQNSLLDINLKLEFVTSDTSNVHRVIERFSPKANLVEQIITEEQEIDILSTTDVMSEGINLQDANCIINYDIHWNPLKLIQRIGRVDRLGTEHDKIYVFNFLPEKELEEDLKIIENVEARISEINEVFGMDAKLLKEDERPNLSYMTSIYQEDIYEVEDFERKILIGEDPITESLNLLKKLMEKEPELITKIKRMDGIRSAKQWEENFDAIFVLCKAGSYIAPYLMKAESNDSLSIYSSIPEYILKSIKSDPDEKPLNVERKVFSEQYSKACKTAIEEFKKDLRERRKLMRTKDSPSRRYVERQLRVYAEELEDEDLKNTINHYRTIIHSTNIDPVLKEFKGIEKNELKGDGIFRAAETIIQKYNLEDKWESRKEWQKTFDEPVHILCGMYLKETM